MQNFSFILRICHNIIKQNIYIYILRIFYALHSVNSTEPMLMVYHSLPVSTCAPGGLTIFDAVCQTKKCNYFIFVVLATIWTRSSKSLILCLYIKIIHANRAKEQFPFFFSIWPTLNNCKTPNLTQSSILMWSFCCNAVAVITS